MEVLIIAGSLMVLPVIYIMSVQRKLAVMDENVNNAMGQVGVRLSARFDVMMALLDLAKGYAAGEARALDWEVRSRRSVITVQSTPEEVIRQEGAVFEALERIAALAEQYPELRADKRYARYMDAAGSYEKMMHTSCFIYNDSVTKFNRAVRTMPASLVAGALGFRRRDYLEAIRDRSGILDFIAAEAPAGDGRVEN